MVFRQPVTVLHVSFMTGSTLRAWQDLDQAELAYSATERQRPSAVVRTVLGSAPHLLLTSLRSRLFLVSTLPLTLVTLFERQRSV